MTGSESEREDRNPVAYPSLSEAQLARLRAYGTPYTVEAGEVLYGPGDATYDLIVAEDPELSDLLLEAFRARRDVLIHNGASRGLELVGSAMDSASLSLRTYAARRRLPLAATTHKETAR